MLWLATQTPNYPSYSIRRTSPGICIQKYCNRYRNKWVNIIFLCSIISLFKFLLKQLITSVSVTGGGYLPGHFAARLTSISGNLKFGEWLSHTLREISIFSINDPLSQRNKIDTSLSKLRKFGLWVFWKAVWYTQLWNGLFALNLLSLLTHFTSLEKTPYFCLSYLPENCYLRHHKFPPLHR